MSSNSVVERDGLTAKKANFRCASTFTGSPERVVTFVGGLSALALLEL
ncbi:hypothetical protein [Kamptonema formosum]|nr:hypothetical protein [Oscillatoria sp. PCC 10802]